MDEILQVENLNKAYKRKHIVKDFSITLKKGHTYTLLGHNGAGKTTAIRTMVGLEDRMNGDILFKGTSIKEDYQHYKSKLGYIPDDDELFDDLTAMEYLKFLGKVRKIPEKDFMNITSHLLDVFDLYSFRDGLLKTFSHGMRRKIQIISAIIHNPEILIVDEPTNGLDPDMIIIFKELLHTLRNLGTAIMLSTHNLEFAENISDSISIIKNGEIKISGLKSDILKELKVKYLEEAYIKVNVDLQKISSIRDVFNYG